MVEIIAAEERIARLLLYRFLSRGYSYPESTWLDILSGEQVWEEVLAAQEVLDLKARSALIEMRAWTKGYKGKEDQWLLALQVEHTHLFITARPHLPAPPYESAYNGRGYLMGEPVSQVLDAYREAGLAIHREYDALPDHIAAELEFVAYLIQKEAEADQAGDVAAAGEWRQRQHRFLEKHLLHWAPQFLEKVMAGARQPFYRLLASLSNAVFSSEARRFAMTLPSRVGIEEDVHG